MRAALALLLLAFGLCAAEPALRELFERARSLAEQNRNLNEAIRLFAQVVAQAKADRALGARAQYEQGLLQERLGQHQQAQRSFRAVLRDFADQTAVVALARRRLPPGAPSGGIATRQVWTGRDVNTLGQVSPDGVYISYMDWTTGQLMIRELKTGDTRGLPPKGSYYSRPIASAGSSVFSPDSRRVAYAWYQDEDCEIRVVGVNGAGMRTLLRVPNGAADVWSWSPDGRTIIVSIYQSGQDPRLVLVSQADGATRALRPSGWSRESAMFSPDGRMIAYGSARTGTSLGTSIRMLATDGASDVPAVQHRADNRLVGWSPDGSRIIFLSERSGTWDLWDVAVGGTGAQGEPRLVKSEVGGEFFPMGMTRSGAIYYATGNSSIEAMIAEVDIERGILVTPPKPVSPRYTGAKATPAWSPDGKSLAYVFGHGRQRHGISILSFPGGEERELYPKQLDSITRIVRWHPAGDSIIVDGASGTVSGHFQVSISDESTRLISNRLGMGVLFPDDVRTAYYGSGNSLFARDLETGEVRTLARHPAPGAFTTSNLSLSPDGSRLGVCMNNAVAAGRQYLAIIPVTGGEPRVLVEMGPSERIAAGGQIWTNDGKYILGASGRNGVSGLWRIPVDGSSPRVRLPVTIPGSMRLLRLHPDGRHLAFIADHTTPEIWVLENATDNRISQSRPER